MTKVCSGDTMVVYFRLGWSGSLLLLLLCEVGLIMLSTNLHCYCPTRASQFFQIAKQIKGDVVEVIWVGCSQILFVQAYFWCFNLQYRSMQWKSLHSSNYFSTFQNSAFPLGHTVKTTKQHLFAIKKESNFHKISKSYFLTVQK